jgi:hypothetical protein
MKRNEALDALRGLFLVVMALNHDGGPLSALTREPLGFFSAAEGFLFLSGLTTGLAYAAPASRPQIDRRPFQKAREIYFYHLLSFLFVVALVSFYPLESSAGRWSDRLLIIQERPLSAILLGAALLYRPAFFDILPMYLFLMLAVPFLIRRFQAGKGTAVLIMSSFLWVLAQTGLIEAFTAPFLRFAETDLGYFDLFAWQFLFVLGAWLGVHREWALRLPHPSGLILPVVFCSLLFLLGRHQVLPLDSILPFTEQHATEKSHLGWLRLIDFLLVAYLIAQFARAYPRLFRWPWLAFLGQHSLQVFTYHVAALYLLELVIPKPIFFYGADPALALSALFVLSLALPAWAHLYWRRLKKRESPTPILSACERSE